MASKLTSQASCIYKPNESNFGGEGGGGKGGYDKVRWDSWTDGETWLDRSFLDEHLFGIKCNSGTMDSKDSRNLWNREHKELDWLSREMAFQELVSCENSTSWFDPKRKNIYGDEHEEDIMSTFTAVASLFRDWCLLEKGITEPGKSSKFYCGCGKYGNSCDYRRDTGKQAEFSTSLLIQGDCFRDRPLDMPVEKVSAEECMNELSQNCLDRRNYVCELARSVGVRTCQEETSVCGSDLENHLRSRSEREVRMYGCQQVNSKCPEDEDDFVQASIMKESIMAADDSLKDCTDIELCSLFGKQICAASWFSFGRDGNEELIANSDFSEKSEGSKRTPGFVQNHDIMAASYTSDYHYKEAKQKEKHFIAQGCISDYHCKQLEQVVVHADDLVPEALLYTLSYMSLQDLLKMEQVCRYLRNRIKSDVLIWQRLHVELPMSNNLTDEILLELASRSRGQLQCLSLVDCTRVTEAALEKIVLSNPRLVKLALPGCSRISADAVIRMVEGHINQRPARVATLKQLRVKNMDGFTNEHLDKLQQMVGVKMEEQSSTKKLQFYHQKHHTSFQGDDRAIDVEVCPQCTNVRLVYDCTRERCQQKRGVSECRACILCIVRCEACGRCITDNNYEETFALDVLCSCCWMELPKCAGCNRPDICSYAYCSIWTPEKNSLHFEKLPETEG